MYSGEVQMYSVGQLLGSLFLAYIVSRGFYFIQRKMLPDLKKSNSIIFAYIFFLLLSTVAGGYGFSRDEQPVFAQAFFQYLPAAVIFLIFDLYKSKSTNETVEPPTEEIVHIQPVAHSPTAENIPVSEKNFCSKCGEKLQESAKFCSGCGTVV